MTQNKQGTNAYCGSMGGGMGGCGGQAASGLDSGGGCGAVEAATAGVTRAASPNRCAWGRGYLPAVASGASGVPGISFSRSNFAPPVRASETLMRLTSRVCPRAWS
jgi:hypothetical protein